MNYELFLLINKTLLISFSLDLVTNKYCIIKNDFFKQFTIWNIISMVLDCYNKQVIMNNITIFVLFHSLFILDSDLMFKIPKRCNISYMTFHLMNIVLHILPVVYSMVYIRSNNIIINNNDIIDNMLYFFTWGAYVNFDYSLYSIDKHYYKYLYFVYFSCLMGYRVLI
jgi:hypothetical protein